MRILRFPRASLHLTLPLIIALAILVLGIATSSRAATSVGGSFIGRGADPADILGASESAGFVPQTHWLNINSGDTFKGTSDSMVDGAGNFTAVKIIYDCNDSWNSDGPTVTPNDKLMKGVIKANPDPDTAPLNNTDRMLFTVTNLSPSTVYNVIVYTTSNGGGAEMGLTVGATTYYIAEEASFSGTFTPATSTTVGDYQPANYAEFDGVTSTANGTIVITALKHVVDPQVNDGIGVAGIQVVKTSGSFPANTTACSITTQPADTLTLDTGTATFTVGTAGPCNIQWTKNGVALPGKTDSTLLYGPATLSDNGALFRAVVNNNVNTVTSSPATLSVDPNTPPSFTQGFFQVQRWENIGGNGGATGIADLKGNIGVNAPTATYYTGGPNVPQTSPDLSNFGSRAWGWVKPDVTGDYNFFIRSDDSSELYLNSAEPGAVGQTNDLPNELDPGTYLIAEEYGCCNPFQEPPAATATQLPIHLVAGKWYGMSALLKEIGGGDYVQVAWRLTTDTTPAGNLTPIPAGNCATMATPAGQRATITTQPVSATVLQGRRTTFSVNVTTTPVAGSYSLQWYKNGVAINGATGPTYTIPAAVWPGDNGAVFSVKAATLRGVLTSANATLTVIQDTFPPVASVGTVTSAGGVVQVGFSFDEPLNLATLVSGNFSIIGGGSFTFNLVTNSYNDYQGVVLDTTGLVPGNTYTGRVQNVSDVYGNAMPQTDVRFSIGPVQWADTGSPARPGKVVPAGPTGFDVLNGGRQEWGTYDEATIAYVKKTNDFDVQVQVIYAEPSSQWSRNGLQARNNLNIGEDPNDRSIGTGPASAYAQTHVNPSQTLGSSGRYDPSGGAPGNQTPNNGHEQNQRLAAGSTSSGWGNAGTPPTYPNAWLRLKRVGAVLRGFRSEDGINWTDQGTTTLVDQQPDMFVGTFSAVEAGNIWPGSSSPPHDVYAGPFDPIYDRLFVTQFRNFTDVPALSIAMVAGRPTVTFTGTLQSSTTINGPWTNVTGATSPYTTPAGPATSFYRVSGSITTR